MRLRVLIPLFAVLAALSVTGQVALRRARPPSAPALAEGAFAALGGLRSIAAEVVWFRMDRLQDEGRYVELAQLATVLTRMEPHTPEVWSHAAWNLAYNVSVMMPTPADRWRWVHAGLRLLRDEGLRFNPRSSDLLRELAWMFELGMDPRVMRRIEETTGFDDWTDPQLSAIYWGARGNCADIVRQATILYLRNHKKEGPAL